MKTNIACVLRHVIVNTFKTNLDLFSDIKPDRQVTNLKHCIDLKYLVTLNKVLYKLEILTYTSYFKQILFVS